MKIKTLTIDRKKWGRGANGGYLLNDFNNKMCCLGFFSRECGLKPKEIRGLIMPNNVLTSMLYNTDDRDTEANVRKYLQKRGVNLEGFDQVSAALAGRLATINDSFTTTDAHKEKKIIELFKKARIKVKFIN